MRRTDRRIFARYPHRMREIQFFCMTVMSIALIASAFVTKPWHLIITIGIMYPFGGGKLSIDA